MKKRGEIFWFVPGNAFFWFAMMMIMLGIVLQFKLGVDVIGLLQMGACRIALQFIDVPWCYY